MAGEELRTLRDLRPPTVGDRLAERYELQAQIGVGAMGTVFRARDRELDEMVAIKVLHPDLVERAEDLERFRREVKLARRITDRRVARVFDVGEDRGARFLTMELIDGEALSRRLARGPLGELELRTVARDLAAGLAAAHQAGVLHRDLKPDNILWAKDGRAVITDFGIACLLGPQGALVTGGAEVVGTPAYIAPEQLEGRAVDGTADLYSLGALLYHAATGELPFSGSTPYQVALARLERDGPDPRVRQPELPDDLGELITHLMRRQPGARPASARDVLRRMGLGAASGSYPVRAPPASRLKSVAVLPALNAGVADDAYLGAAFTDDLIDLLAQGRRLHVISRAAAARALVRAAGDVRAVAEALRVDALVEAEVSRRGQRLRVVVRLLDGPTGRQLLSARREVRLSESLALDAELAVQIAAELEVELGVTPRAAPPDDASVERYLRARALVRSFSAHELSRAAAEFEAAAEAAPGFAPALAGAAQARMRLWIVTGNPADGARAATAAQHALGVDRHLDEARLCSAILMLHEGRFAQGAREIALLAARAPTNALAQWEIAVLTTELGAHDRALRALDRMEWIEPGGLQARWLRAILLARDGDVAAALAELSAMRAGAPAAPEPYAFELRFRIWAGEREPVAALAAAPPPEPLPRVYAAVVRAMAAAADGATLDAALGEIERIASVWLRNWGRQLSAEAAASSGREELARELVGRAVEEGLFDACWLERCPLFQRMRAAGMLDEALARARMAAERVSAALAPVG